jgi:hypothetical protein
MSTTTLPLKRRLDRLTSVAFGVLMLVIVSWPLVLPELGLTVTQAVVVALLAMPLALAGVVWWAQSALIGVRLVALVGVSLSLSWLAVLLVQRLDSLSEQWG